MPHSFWTYAHLQPREAIVAMVRDGFSVIPVNGRTKKPLVRWQSYQSEPPSLAEAEQWASTFGENLGIGLLTGRINGWVAIDADNQEAADWVRSTFPTTPVRQISVRGVHHFYRLGSKAIPTVAGLGPSGKTDVRGQGGYIIVAPSACEQTSRHFAVSPDVSSTEVPTLDDLQNFDALFQTERRRVDATAIAGGQGSEVVRNAEGRVIDGRESYLRDITYAVGHQLAATFGETPTAYLLARAAWEIFNSRADLSDGKWHFEHAVEKATYFCQRVAEGAIALSDLRPPVAPSQARPLLSPEEAGQILRNELATFLNYRAIASRPDEIQHLLIKSPAGLGKTTSAVQLCTTYILEQQALDPLDLRSGAVSPDLSPSFLLYVRTHSLASEIKEKIEHTYASQGRDLNVPVWRGRTNADADGRTPCRLPDLATQLASRGLPVGSNLCQRNDGANIHECSFFTNCEYMSVRRRFSPYTILMAAELPFADRQPFQWAHEELDDPSVAPDEHAFFVPAKDGGTFLIDESPIEYLKEETVVPDRVLDDLDDLELVAVLREGLRAERGLLTTLRERNIAVHRVRRAGIRRERQEASSGRVGTPGDAASISLSHVQRVHRFGAGLRRLADELGSGRNGKAYSVELDTDKIRLRGRRRFGVGGMPGLIFDATGDVTILRQFVPNVRLQADIRVERNAFITQISDQSFSETSLDPSLGNPNLFGEVEDFIRVLGERIYAETERRTLVVTYKDIRKRLSGETAERLPPASRHRTCATVDVAHFGALRGLDTFKDHHAVIVIGRQQPPPHALEDQARAIWFDDPNPLFTVPERGQYPRRLGKYTIRGLGDFPTSARGVAYHPDERVQALLQQTREAETTQAFDRLRLVHSTVRKEVYIISNVPLPDLTIDRLLTWEDLRAGGARLELVLQECDNLGLTACLLTPTWLVERFPQFWTTLRAASRWLDDRPLDKNRSYSYWGQQITYRLVGHGGRPRNAFVKNGVEEAKSSIAHSLGLDPILVVISRTRNE